MELLDAFRVDDRGVRAAGRLLGTLAVDDVDRVAVCFVAADFSALVFVPAGLVDAPAVLVEVLVAVLVAVLLTDAAFFAAAVGAAAFLDDGLAPVDFAVDFVVDFVVDFFATVFFDAARFAGAARFGGAFSAVDFFFATATIGEPPGECERRTLPAPSTFVRVLQLERR